MDESLQLAKKNHMKSYLIKELTTLGYLAEAGSIHLRRIETLAHYAAMATRLNYPKNVLSLHNS